MGRESKLWYKRGDASGRARTGERGCGLKQPVRGRENCTGDKRGLEKKRFATNTVDRKKVLDHPTELPHSLYNQPGGECEQHG